MKYVIAGPLTLGRASGGNDLFFVGLMDEAHLYRRALADDEIAALFNGPFAIGEPFSS